MIYFSVRRRLISLIVFLLPLSLTYFSVRHLKIDMEPLQFLLYLFPSLMPVKNLCASFDALDFYIKFGLSLSTASAKNLFFLTCSHPVLSGILQGLLTMLNSIDSVNSI